MPAPPKPETVMLRGTGGAVFAFDLPLAAVYADQVAKGALQPADAESAKLCASHGYTSAA